MMQRLRTWTESTSCSPWKSIRPPHRVLIIRMHAVGDVAISFPAVAGLMEHLPGAQIDFFTTQTCAAFFIALSISGNVFSFPDRLSRWGRLFWGLHFARVLRERSYDIVIDLQRNWVTRLVRRMIAPRSWSEFERFAPISAGERVLKSFKAAGFQQIPVVHDLPMNIDTLDAAKRTLLGTGWNGTDRLIVLNPAGLWKSRQWPIENYIHLARLMLDNEPTLFLLLGTERVREKARHIKEVLGDSVVNLVDRTTLDQTFALLQFCDGMATEDSGLMHMAWASGIPTVALFGSTNHVWSAPTGNFVRCFHSGDLPCSACMQPECKFGDVHCLTRLSPQMVYEAIREVLTSRPHPRKSTASITR